MKLTYQSRMWLTECLLHLVLNFAPKKGNGIKLIRHIEKYFKKEFNDKNYGHE